MPDPYDALQIARNAEPEVVAAAYRTLARKYHPDKNAAPASNKRMQEINAAYEILKDPVKRKEYDRDHPFPSGRFGWRSEEAIDWSSAFNAEEWDDWASAYGRRKINHEPIRRPGFLQRNLGCILYLIFGLFAAYQVLIVVVRKW
jgi:curved DNA-binding protein CbpA